MWDISHAVNAKTWDISHSPIGRLVCHLGLREGDGAVRFVAIDVETANPDPSTICQVGAVLFEDGEETDSYKSLVNPRCSFHHIHTGIHGITEDDVIESPLFLAIIGHLNALFRSNVVVSHGSFDRSALEKACRKLGSEIAPCEWLDTVALARWAWPDQAEKGYKLSDLAERLAIDFNHHDALDDARTSGLVALAALRDLNVSLAVAVAEHSYRGGGQSKSKRGKAASSNSVLARDHSPGSGPLSGERLVFTGAISIDRGEAARAANALGAHCSDSVSKKTTLLIVGDKESSPASEHAFGRVRMSAQGPKSGKHLKAERLIAEGVPIRIIGETEFLSLISSGEKAGEA